MRRRFLDRLTALEHKIKAVGLFWPDDSDRFLAALGFPGEAKRPFERKNADGSVGYDEIAALSSTATADWRPESE